MSRKDVNGETYLSIGEVAKKIKRSTQTIKHWYAWAEKNDRLRDLPEIKRFGKLGVRHFREKDIAKLRHFRDSIAYGMMSDFNVQNWGERGRRIMDEGTQRKK